MRTCLSGTVPLYNLLNENLIMGSLSVALQISKFDAIVNISDYQRLALTKTANVLTIRGMKAVTSV